MWYFLYNLTATAALALAFPFVPVILVLGERYREGFAQRWGFYPKDVCRTVASHPVWIHAASVGEVRSAAPLVREIKARFPSRSVVLSTFTATGNRLARSMPGVDAAIYLPLDFHWVVGRALNQFRPALLVIIETEIWPNLLRGAFRRGIPTVLLSGRMSKRAFARYSTLRAFFSRVLQCFTLMGMQTPADAARVVRLGAEERKVVVTGSLKFATASGSRTGANVAAFLDRGRRWWVAGSSHAGEEAILLKALATARQRVPELSLVLAPRHPERFAEVEDLLAKNSFVFRRKSRLTDEAASACDVLLLDTLGELPEFFAVGEIAFVGGSLVDAGGHNLLEPARLKKPILFGPYTANVKDLAEQMKREGAAIEVRGVSDLAQVLVDLLSDPAACRRMGEAAARIAAAERDTLARNFCLVERFL